MSITTYNQKQFLAPQSINSMSVVHCKLYKDGKAVVRVSDCHKSIRIWNNITEPGERDEMIKKLFTLEKQLFLFRSHLQTLKQE